MHNTLFIVRSFRNFYNHNPLKISTLLLITLFLGFSQGITIMMLIPLLSLLDPASLNTQNDWTNFLYTWFDKCGLEVNTISLLLLFLFSFSAIALLTYFQTILQTNYQQEFSYQTRKRLFKKIITSDWNYLNGKSKYNHIQVLTTEIPKTTTYYQFYLNMISKIILIIAHICLTLIISPLFTLFVTIIGISIFLLLRKYLKKNIILGGQNIIVSRKILKHIDDFWNSVKTAKVHQSEKFYYNKFDEANKQILDYQYKQIRNKAIPQLLFTIAGIIALLSIIFFAFQIAHLALASIFILILLFARIFPQFIGINNDLNMLFSYIESVRTVLKTDTEIEEHDFNDLSNIKKITLNHHIELKNIFFNYDNQKHLFSNFSTTISANKITGIIGKSGSGKTTLMDIIAGIQTIHSGKILLDYTELNNQTLSAWKNEIGYLPQDSFFIDGTIRENLIWDSKKLWNDEQIINTLKLLNADCIISRQTDGLNTYITNYNYHFSGGERQRLALTRVLLRNPKILLLDEATSALDYDNEIMIMECLSLLKKNITIIFITHRHQLIPYFDSIIHLDENNTYSNHNIKNALMIEQK